MGVYICVHVYTYTYINIYIMEYYSAIKKDEILEILPFATMWMDLESTIFSEISQTEKNKYSVIIYMWNLKNKTVTCI